MDISPACAPVAARTGLSRVALDLASALARREDIDLTVTAWGWVQAAFDLPDAISGSRPHIRTASLRLNAVERAYSKRWKVSSANGQVPRWLVRSGQGLNLMRNPVRGLDPGSFDIVHSTYSRVPRHIRRWGKPVVLTLHDLTPLKLDRGMVPRPQIAITTRIVRSVRPSDWIVPISTHTRSDFIGENASHPEERIRVIPDAVDHEVFKPVSDRSRIASVKERHGIPDGPFHLTMSSLAPHKNLPFLLRLWPRVRQAHPNATLVVVGGKAADRGGIAAGFGETNGVHYTGFVPDCDLTVLLSACEAFLFPSLYEGFGLPVLEAMACGSPVVAADRTSLPEVAGDAATLLDPEDSDAWVEGITAALAVAPRTGVHEASIRQASRFNWDAVASEYVSLYRHAIHG